MGALDFDGDRLKQCGFSSSPFMASQTRMAGLDGFGTRAGRLVVMADPAMSRSATRTSTNHDAMSPLLITRVCCRDPAARCHCSLARGFRGHVADSTIQLCTWALRCVPTTGVSRNPQYCARRKLLSQSQSPLRREADLEL